jgi:hypothetical protein
MRLNEGVRDCDLVFEVGSHTLSLADHAGASEGEIAIAATPSVSKSSIICTSPASSEVDAGPV